jgi:hypothetical protein
VGGLFGGGYFLIRRQRAGAIAIALLVVSHWVLDAVVHRPDLPLTPGGELRIGLGLWNSLAGTLVVELAMFAVGIWLYSTCTRARDRVGTAGFVALLGTILLIYVGSIFGPPPPSAVAVAWTDMGQWLVIVWAAWVDRHRTLEPARGLAAP